MSEIKRKKGESFEGFMRRVKDQWKRAGTILQVRKIQFFESKPSKNVQRKQTVTRIRKTKMTDYLRKTGKLPAKLDDPRNQKRKR